MADLDYYRASQYDRDDAPLSTDERRFVLTYVRTSNGREAAIEAGWIPPAAQRAASRMLRTERIRRAIKSEQARLVANIGLTAQRLVAELANIATASMGDYLEAVYDEQGRYVGRRLNLEHASAAQMACIAEHSVVDGVERIKLHDKQAAINTLAKMFEMTPDVVRLIVPGYVPERPVKTIDAEPLDAAQAAKAYAAMLDDTEEAA